MTLLMNPGFIRHLSTSGAGNGFLKISTLKKKPCPIFRDNEGSVLLLPVKGEIAAQYAGVAVRFAFARIPAKLLCNLRPCVNPYAGVAELGQTR